MFRDADRTRYEHADGLVGVYREQVMNSSQTLSLDLAKVSWQCWIKLTSVRVGIDVEGRDQQGRRKKDSNSIRNCMYA
jgi:hypothetical protein